MSTEEMLQRGAELFVSHPDATAREVYGLLESEAGEGGLALAESSWLGRYSTQARRLAETLAVEQPPASGRLAEVMKSGDHRACLEALRDTLAEGMESAEPNVMPQYAARLQAVLTELASLPNPEVSPADELAARRKARRDEADAGMRAKRRRAQSRD